MPKSDLKTTTDITEESLINGSHIFLHKNQYTDDTLLKKLLAMIKKTKTNWELEYIGDLCVFTKI